MSASWKCLTSTPAFARCAQVIVGPFGPINGTEKVQLSHLGGRAAAWRTRPKILKNEKLGNDGADRP